MLSRSNRFKLMRAAVFFCVLLVLSSSSASAQMKLYVGNLSFQTSSEELRELFSAVGTVVSATVVKDKKTGRSRGFGFVVMETRAAGEAAIRQFNGKEFNGRTLTVNEALPRAEPTNSEGGRGGAGRRGRGGPLF